ncbi:MULTISPECIES: TetR/AcrR family transcriptional regulator [unclassified Nocardioides]|uniref:TetR/AcrR family transcriptional regulator n=1 Tax=unclassified Nocardioides TaxID=2615069 RepID=UPI0036219E5A
MSRPNPQRRNAASHRAILEAAWAEVLEKGYEGLTIEGIAARAGVGKQTLYRWWPSKAAVLLEAVNARTQQTSTFPDTGDVVADLGGQLAGVATFLADEGGTVHRALLAGAQSDPSLASELRRQIIEPRTHACVERLVEAQAAGQIRADVDPLDIVELVYAPLYYRMILGTRPLSAIDARQQLQRILDGLAVTS